MDVNDMGIREARNLHGRRRYDYMEVIGRTKHDYRDIGGRVTPGAITEDTRAESRVRNRDLENAWSRFSRRQNDYMK